MNIWAPKMTGHACTKIPYKGYEISIAMDDSCGVFEHYSRSKIAVFHTTQGTHCVTNLFFDDVDGFSSEAAECDATAENLIAIFARIDNLVADQQCAARVDLRHDVAYVPDSGEKASCPECKRLWRLLKAKREGVR